METITSPPMQQNTTSLHSVLSPLLISILGIIATSVAILLYHFFLLKYCLSRRSSTAAATQPAAATPPFTGVEEKILEAIPILPFSVAKRDNVDQEECVVCLGELADEDTVRLLPDCKHAFHVTCIDQWFAAHASCPLCRSPILEQTNDAVDARASLVAHPSNDSDREISESSARNSSSIIEPSSSSPLPRAQSFGLLRHCASFVLPPPAERRQSPPRLKRSLSMDQSFVAINLQRASSSSFSRGRTPTRSGRPSSRRSMSLFDRAPNWLRSFSRLRVGKGSNGPILPY